MYQSRTRKGATSRTVSVKVLFLHQSYLGAENGRHSHHGRKNQQNSLPPPRAAVERRSSTAMTDTNVTDQQSRGAFGSHAPHAGRVPRSTGAIQRVSQSLMRAVARLLRRRIRLATRAAAELKSRRPHVIRRRRDRIPRIVSEVADPFPQVMKTWHHFHFGLLHMQCVSGGPRVDAPSYALEHASMGAQRKTTNTFGCSHGTSPTCLPTESPWPRSTVATIRTLCICTASNRSARRMPLLCSMATRDG